MRLPRSRSLLPVFFGLIVVASGSSATKAAPPTRDQLRAILKQLWDSIDTLEFRNVEYNANQQGVIDLSRGFSRFEFAMGSGGRRASQLFAIRPSGEELMGDMREDGRKRYGVEWVPDQSGAVNQISIANQEDTNERYSGTMSHPLYLLMPFGRPLYAHLDEHAAVEVSKNGDGKDQITLVFKNKGHQLRYELDESHDWLPRRQLMEQISDTKVTRFERIDGRWFPIEGHIHDLRPERRLVFKVSNVHFNRPLPETTFNPMSLKQDGTIIADSTKKVCTDRGGRNGEKGI